MDIKLAKEGGNQGVISINLIEEDYSAKYDAKLKDYGKKAKINGFRPGKVPAGLIKKMYGKSILVEEVNQLLSESLYGYIQDQKINIIGEPLPDMSTFENVDWDSQKEFDFSYKIGFAPEIELEKALDNTFTKYEIKLEDKYIQESIDDIQKGYGEKSAVEESAEDDMITGLIINEDSEIENQVHLHFNTIEKGFKKTLIGLKKDDTIDFDVEKAFGKDDAKIARYTNVAEDAVSSIKSGTKFKVESIERTTPSELNEELFNKVFPGGEVKDEETFKQKIEETIAQNYVRECDNRLNVDIQKHLVDNISMDLPESFLKEWLVATNESLTSEKVEEDYENILQEVKWSLIKNKIIEKEGVEAKYEDVFAFAKASFGAQYGISGDGNPEMDAMLSQVTENYLKEENGKNYQTIFEQYMFDASFKKMIEGVKTKAKKVSVDDFNKLNN